MLEQMLRRGSLYSRRSSCFSVLLFMGKQL
jgi:hypothetical protein